MAGNANSGRRRKSKALRDLHGSVTRPHHRERPEPQYAVSVPPVPASLGPIARAEWDRITAELDAKRVIAMVDLAILAVYCTTFERLEEIRSALGARTKTGRAKVTVGSQKWHRLERSERQQTTVLKSVAVELGITPASRAKVSPLPPLVDPAEASKPATDQFEELSARLKGQAKVVLIDGGRRT